MTTGTGRTCAMFPNLCALQSISAKVPATFIAAPVLFNPEFLHHPDIAEGLKRNAALLPNDTVTGIAYTGYCGVNVFYIQSDGLHTLDIGEYRDAFQVPSVFTPMGRSIRSDPETVELLGAPGFVLQQHEIDSTQYKLAPMEPGAAIEDVDAAMCDILGQLLLDKSELYGLLGDLDESRARSSAERQASLMQALAVGHANLLHAVVSVENDDVGEFNVMNYGDFASYTMEDTKERVGSVLENLDHYLPGVRAALDILSTIEDEEIVLLVHLYDDGSSDVQLWAEDADAEDPFWYEEFSALAPDQVARLEAFFKNFSFHGSD